ncbi:MAG: flavocytochrome c [Spirochaetales bacterium]|nr:MAG: flavocytochrome c [Spirochaetales bacterium]
MKKIIVPLVLLFLALGLMSCQQAKYSDGVYTGTAKGKGGDLVVEVTVKDGDIDKAVLVSSHETEMISDMVITKILDAVNKEKSINIDAVSGASMTSEALVSALKDALRQAGGTDKIFAEDKKVVLSDKEEQLVQNYDVVIVGAGGAGLSAAVEAQAAGAKVVVLEKNPSVGGNTLVSGGGLNVPGSSQQKAKGIEDSVELFVKDTLKGGDFKGNEKLVRVFAQGALPASRWLTEDLGVRFMEDRVQQFGGHSVPRALVSKGNHGTELIKKLWERALGTGVVIKLETKAVELITDGGRVTGVKAVNAAGQDLTFNASRAVILATGGFGANVEMRKEYNSEYDERYMTTDLPSTTGDGIVMAEKVDAALTGMVYIQTYPTCNPVTGIISYVANSRFYGAILVNAEGRRFVEEMGRRDLISKEILAQTDSNAFLVWGQEIESAGNMNALHKDEYALMKSDDLIDSADTLKDLAEHFGVDVTQLEKTVEQYNRYVKDGKDEEFNRRGKLRTIAEGPFYMQRVIPSVHHTMGGLVINEKAQVLNESGQIIPGLYAAGEVTGGIHGTNRLGGNAVTDVVVFGRIAGQNAAK